MLLSRDGYVNLNNGQANNDGTTDFVVVVAH